MGFGFISIIKVTVIISIKRGPYLKEAKRDSKIQKYFKLFKEFHIHFSQNTIPHIL